MKRYRDARTGTPYIKTSCIVLGERQIETFEALVFLRGFRRPHELVADIVLDEIRKAQKNKEIQTLVGHMRASRASRGIPTAPERGGLRLVHEDDQ